ncbi:MAG: rhomboid family intramembrane serine protease [Desulfotomaculaceae bacterium]|nr:rhomboid family intramembrane serine protease [Desulfotomaculaceae bacterium]
MFPLRDNIPSQNPPYMTVILVIVNTVIFTYIWLMGPNGMEQVFNRYALIPADITGVSQQGGGWATLFTSMFLHGGWLHLIGNMWALWLFGDNVEDLMGPLNFLLFYLVCGLGAAAVHIYVDPVSTVPTVGASGAIAGIMGAYFLLYPRARVTTLVFTLFIWFVDIPAYIYLGFWILMQLLGGTAVLAGGASQIAFWAHVGGFAAGMLFYSLFKTRQENRRIYWE